MSKDSHPSPCKAFPHSMTTNKSLNLFHAQYHHLCDMRVGLDYFPLLLYFCYRILQERLYIYQVIIKVQNSTAHFFFFFLRLHLQHLEDPRLGVELEAAAAGLCHSNVESEPTLQLVAMMDL